jgi:hypothetical protein
MGHGDPTGAVRVFKLNMAPSPRNLTPPFRQKQAENLRASCKY